MKPPHHISPYHNILLGTLTLTKESIQLEESSKYSKEETMLTKLTISLKRKWIPVKNVNAAVASIKLNLMYSLTKEP